MNDTMGLSDFHTNTIYLSKEIKNKELLEHTFLHELLHFVVLHSKVVNKYKLDNGNFLYDDETFIDNISALLHQALKTQTVVTKRKVKKTKC